MAVVGAPGGGFAANGFGELSPGKYGLPACFLTEILATFFFLFIIIGTTSKGAAAGFAGIPIGLALTLIHLVTIPVTNTSVNPARSTGPALFAGGAYVGQLWLFWVTPIAGAIIAGLLTRWMYEQEKIIVTTVVEERRVS
jgi:aquaporin Z